MILALLKACLNRKNCEAGLKSDQRGFATGTVMIIAGLMAAVAVSLVSLNSEMSVRDLRYLHFHSSLDIIQSNLYAFGQNDAAFDATLAANVALSRMLCIENQTTCSTPASFAAAERVILAWPSGTTYYNYADITKTGFTYGGEPCSYNATRVTNGCVLRLDVRWSPFCNNVPCIISRDGPNRLVFMIDYTSPTLDAGGNPIAKFLLPLNLGNYDSTVRMEGPLNSMSKYR